MSRDGSEAGEGREKSIRTFAAFAFFARNKFYVRSGRWQLVRMLSQEAIQNALKAVKYPGFSRDIVSFGLVKEISAANGAVSVTMQLTSPNPEAAQQIKTESERVLKNLPGVNHVHVEVQQPAAGQAATGNTFAESNQSSRRETRHRRRQRQRRRRQIHLFGEPRLRAETSRRESRFAGLRHLRAEHSADDGRSRTSDRQRRRAPRAAGRTTA